MNPFEMMQKMKNMQSEMKKIQAELAAETVIGKSSRGAVTVELNGAMQVKRVSIDPRFLEQPEAAQLEKWVAESVAQALEKAQKLAASRMTRMTGGINPLG
jgi:nucleoid-associated protein EbfC